MESMMQKSAHTNKAPNRAPLPRFESTVDKGQKFEPFWTAALGSDRRSLARVQKADQKR
jgi:hypothetical protein